MINTEGKLKMKGTLVNAAAVIAGGILGLLLRRGIKESFQKSMNKALGASVSVIGINGVISSMASVKEGKLSTSGELLLVVSLVFGTLLGEIVGIDDGLNKLSRMIERKLSANDFAVGFMNATVMFCVGAMAIIGALNDGLAGDSSTLYVKSALDFASAAVLSSTLGEGVIFSFVPLLLYQGSISIFAKYLSSVLQGELLNQVCAVGYTVIICIGINFLSEEKIKTANMLPAILMPVVYAGLKAVASVIKF